jgi:hypothetical protein
MACYPDTVDLSDDFISKEDIKTQLTALYQTTEESEIFSDSSQKDMVLWATAYKSALEHIYVSLLGDYHVS